MEDEAVDERAAPLFHADVGALFATHVEHLQKRRKQRISSLVLRTVAESEESNRDEARRGPREDDADGEAAFQDSRPVVVPVHANNDDEDTALHAVMGDTDEFEGDLVLRRLQILLARIDERGYLRSRQQVRFHDAFVRATSRVIYKADWSSARPRIVEKNGWSKTPSEILISTPRRFGKTFRFCNRNRPRFFSLDRRVPHPLRAASRSSVLRWRSAKAWRLSCSRRRDARRASCLKESSNSSDFLDTKTGSPRTIKRCVAYALWTALQA